VVSVAFNNFKKGNRYYYYVLTGGTDNGDFSRKVYVNGKTTTLAGGGPTDYATLKPYGTTIAGDIKLTLPKYSTIYLLVENNKNLQTQTIQFDPVPAKAVGDTGFVIAATASSGLPVQFASANPKVAKVAGTKVQVVGAGTCNIIAFQEGDSIYAPATQVIQKLTVAKGNQAITFPELAPKTTGDLDFSAGATASSGLVCALTSSNPAVATIVNGLIQIKGAGSSVITAKQTGNVNYNAAGQVSQELIVTVKTAIDQIPVENDFEIFPNPATGFVTVRTNSNYAAITIYNSVGAMVYKNVNPDAEIRIPVNQIGESGVYFIRINSMVRKFVIIE